MKKKIKPVTFQKIKVSGSLKPFDVSTKQDVLIEFVKYVSDEFGISFKRCHTTKSQYAYVKTKCGLVKLRISNHAIENGYRIKEACVEISFGYKVSMAKVIKTLNNKKTYEIVGRDNHEHLKVIDLGGY